MDSELLVQFLLALGAVLFLIVVIAWLLKKVNLVSSRVGRYGEETRLSVSEAIAVDHRRKLVLVKRDHMEHLILIGGENDLLLEHAIPPQARPQPPQQKAASLEQTSTRQTAMGTASSEARKVETANNHPVQKAARRSAPDATGKTAANEHLTAPVSAAIDALSSTRSHNSPEQTIKQHKAVETSKIQDGSDKPAHTPPPPQPVARHEQDQPHDTSAGWPLASHAPAPQQQQSTPPDKSDKPAGPIFTAPSSVPAQPTTGHPSPDAEAPHAEQPQKAPQSYQDEITRLLDELSNDSKKS